jgi:hypothetical protein
VDIVDEQEKNQSAVRIVKERLERYQIFGFILMIMIALEIMLPERPLLGRK